MNTKLLMILSVFFLGALGIILSFFPKEILEYINIDTNPFTILFLQLLGALYLGFGILNWMAKGTLIGGIYNRPIAIGNFMHFSVGAITLIKIVSSIQTHREIIIGITIVYVVFAVLFVYVFRTNPGKAGKNNALFIFIGFILLNTSCVEKSLKSELNSKENMVLTVKKMNQNKLKKFGHEYTKAWNSEDPTEVASFFASDGVLNVNNDPSLVGRKAITEFAKGFMIAFPDMILSMDSLIIKSDETQYHWSFVGTNTGPDGTGNKVMFSGFESWSFNEEHQIKISIGSFDTEDYNRQLNAK